MCVCTSERSVLLFRGASQTVCRGARSSCERAQRQRRLHRRRRHKRKQRKGGGAAREDATNASQSRGEKGKKSHRKGLAPSLGRRFSFFLLLCCVRAFFFEKRSCNGRQTQILFFFGLGSQKDARGGPKETEKKEHATREKGLTRKCVRWRWHSVVYFFWRDEEKRRVGRKHVQLDLQIFVVCLLLFARRSGFACLCCCCVHRLFMRCFFLFFSLPTNRPTCRFVVPTKETARLVVPLFFSFMKESKKCAWTACLCSRGVLGRCMGRPLGKKKEHDMGAASEQSRTTPNRVNGAQLVGSVATAAGFVAVCGAAIFFGRVFLLLCWFASLKRAPSFFFFFGKARRRCTGPNRAASCKPQVGNCRRAPQTGPASLYCFSSSFTAPSRRPFLVSFFFPRSSLLFLFPHSLFFLLGCRPPPHWQQQATTTAAATQPHQTPPNKTASFRC